MVPKPLSGNILLYYCCINRNAGGKLAAIKRAIAEVKNAAGSFLVMPTPY